MRKRILGALGILVLLPPALAAIAGWLVAPAFLHPMRRPLPPELIRAAAQRFQSIGASREDFDVHAPDGVLLRGWKVRPLRPSGSWVLLFHGVADNRLGVMGQADMLLRAGYGVVMMDARAHGQSEGPAATYGWLERADTRATIGALLASEPKPMISSPEFHLFALGESMGAGIALQSAAIDPRIEAVVAEAPFASLREAAYDYAGLRKSPLLGKTLFRPFTWTLLGRGSALAGFPAGDVSPEQSVSGRPFPVLLICDERDEALPCRHTRAIFDAARGSKQLWVVPGAYHTAAIGFEPVEFRRRVLAFYSAQAAGPSRSEGH
ncbi:MAG TPA: alpha/beta fold hydrolase [Candidatus Acidoferrum sp.]|nr:alpha/beta fold hydrolase [Candidatus Acidoferrum sp.]